MKNKNLISTLSLIGMMILMMAVLVSCKKKEDEPKIQGCMDPNSLTYNPAAEEDNGSCLQPEPVQHAIIMDFTATWCSPCGANGIPMFESAIERHPNELVPLSCHNSDEMSNTTTDGLLSAYGITGIPTIIVGNQGSVWGDPSIDAAVATTIAATPIAAPCALMTTSGSTITIKTQTKFFSATSGTYYLATYIMENNCMYTQNSATPDPYPHQHVVHGVATGGCHGEVIGSGSIASGTLVNKSYTVTAQSGWNLSNVYVACVIWKYTGSTWTYVNARQTINN